MGARLPLLRAGAIQEFLVVMPNGRNWYGGDHVNRISERLTTRVLPFFSEALVGSQGGGTPGSRAAH